MRTLLSALMSTALLVTGAAAQNINTHIISPNRVERVSTSLNHISIIDMPEPVISAAIGSDEIRMETHGSQVLIEPLRAGVDTDLMVFTARSHMDFDIQPAGDPKEMTYTLVEQFPAPPPPPPGPSPEELQRQRDSLLGSILITTRQINTKHISRHKKVMQIRVVSVSEDAKCYYVRLRGYNGGLHAYRIHTPVVSKIDPAFGANIAYRMVGQQINQRSFNRFKLYSERALVSHGSTLVQHDLQPGEYTEWIMAVNKPDVTPGMYKFTFSDDAENPVSAIVIF